MKTYASSKGEFVSERTLSTYSTTFVFLNKYLKEIKREDILITQVDTFFVEAFIRYSLSYVSLKTDRILKRNTVLLYRDKLTGFLNWCVKKEFIERNPFDRADFGTVLKGEVTALHEVMSLEDWQRVIEYFAKKKGDSTITICLIMYYTHLRPREVLRIQMKNIDLKNRYIELEPGKYKNRRERKLPIDEPLYEHLKSLDIDYNKNPENYLIGFDRKDWASYSKPEPYTYQCFYIKFKHCKRILKLSPNTTPYGIKHTASVHEFIHENMSKEQIRVKSGHATIAQTEIYMKGLTDIINVPDYQPRKLKFKI